MKSDIFIIYAFLVDSDVKDAMPVLFDQNSLHLTF